MFQPLDVEEEKEIKEIKTIEKYKEINKTYYNNKDYSFEKREKESKKYYYEGDSDNDEQEDDFKKGKNTYKSGFRKSDYNNIEKNPEFEEIKVEKKKYNFTKYPGSSSYFKDSGFEDMKDE